MLPLWGTGHLRQSTDGEGTAGVKAFANGHRAYSVALVYRHHTTRYYNNGQQAALLVKEELLFTTGKCGCVEARGPSYPKED